MSGFSKNMTMVANHDDVAGPDFSISADKAAKSVAAGDSVSFNITISASNGFSEMVYIDLESPEAGIELAGFDSQTVSGSGTARITFDIDKSFTPSTETVKINAYGAGMSRSISLSLDIKEGISHINVVSVTPKDDAHDVELEHLEIEIEFDGTIDTETLTDENIMIMAGAEKYKGTMKLSDDKRTVSISDIHAEADEREGLPGNATVKVTVGTGVRTLDGSMLESDYTWEFTTAEEEHHESEEMEGLYLSLVIIIVIVLLMVIAGVIYGRRQPKDEVEEEKVKEDER
jgi:hypothetical protein